MSALLTRLQQGFLLVGIGSLAKNQQPEYLYVSRQALGSYFSWANLEAAGRR